MFSFKNKLSPDLKTALDNKYYKNYRVIILCKTLQESVENKIKSYNCKVIRSIPLLNCISAYMSPHAIERLIEYCEISYITFDNFALICGNSVLNSNGVTLEKRYTLTGKNIGIALIDTGVFPHPDLINPHNKITEFTDLINNKKYPYDDNGHGTFMAGIICGSGYSSKFEFKGVAENSNLYCIKAFNSNGRAFISDILFSIQLIIEKSKKDNIRILCLPFETIDYDYFTLSLFSSIFKIATDEGLIIVLPSGHNNNVECSIRGIACLENCITVGGVDSRNFIKPSCISSSGPFGKLEKPDLCATSIDICSLNCNPKYESERNGVKIYADVLETPYTTYSGTSCSAAFIAGVCALLLENNPSLKFKDILSLLKVSCKLLDMPKSLQGSGIIDINKLLP